MGDSTANALLAAASCNALLKMLGELVTSLDRMERSSDAVLPTDFITTLFQWTIDAREIVLDIKSRL